jgi:hypothetical protein
MMNPDGGDGDRLEAAGAGSSSAQQGHPTMEWRFAQVFGERAAGEDVQEGTLPCHPLARERPGPLPPTPSRRLEIWSIRAGLWLRGSDAPARWGAVWDREGEGRAALGGPPPGCGGGGGGDGIGIGAEPGLGAFGLVGE